MKNNYSFFLTLFTNKNIKKKLIYVLSLSIFMISCVEVNSNETSSESEKKETEVTEIETPENSIPEIEEVKSIKGAWTEEELAKMDAEVQQIDGELDALGDNKQTFLDCYTESIEANYDNFTQANMDSEGCKQLASQCAESLK